METANVLLKVTESQGNYFAPTEDLQERLMNASLRAKNPNLQKFLPFGIAIHNSDLTFVKNFFFFLFDYVSFLKHGGSKIGGKSIHSSKCSMFVFHF